MNSEFGEFLRVFEGYHLPILEWETYTQLKKLHTLTKQRLPRLRRAYAGTLLFPPHAEIPSIQWAVVAESVREVFQIDSDTNRAGLALIVPSPDLSQARHDLLRASANGVEIRFSKTFNYRGDNFYTAEHKIEEDGPLVKDRRAIVMAHNISQTIQGLARRDTILFLELMARFSFEALMTDGFKRGEQFIDFDNRVKVTQS